jgi:hypothetical protein
MARLSVSFAASLLLLLVSGWLPAVFAGDGDVDYSAPYITVDPETGQLVTVNPGPQLKSHAAPAGSDSAVQPSDDPGPVTSSDTAATASGTESENVFSGLPVILVAMLAAIVVSAGIGFWFRGHRKMSDA